MFVCKLPSTAELIELATTGENDEGHLSITENRKFISFLEQTISSLWESHLAVDLVFDPPQLHSPSPHDFLFSLFFSQKLWKYKYVIRKLRYENVSMDKMLDSVCVWCNVPFKKRILRCGVMMNNRWGDDRKRGRKVKKKSKRGGTKKKNSSTL